jgi:hypothetical protein
MQPRRPRQPHSTPARIVTNNGKSVLVCTIHDLSSSGAGLEVGPTSGLPSQFWLESETLPRTRCRLVWAGQSRIGVRFL